MDTLLLRYPQASFTKLCCDYSGLAKVWLVEDRPVHPVLFEVSEASRRRWRLLHSIVFACKWRSVHTGWPLPEGVRNAIGAFRVPLPGENQRVSQTCIKRSSFSLIDSFYCPGFAYLFSQSRSSILPFHGFFAQDVGSTRLASSKILLSHSGCIDLP
jgi:hypothetical protein